MEHIEQSPEKTPNREPQGIAANIENDGLEKGYSLAMEIIIRDKDQSVGILIHPMFSPFPTTCYGILEQAKIELTRYYETKASAEKRIKQDMKIAQDKSKFREFIRTMGKGKRK